MSQAQRPVPCALCRGRCLSSTSARELRPVSFSPPPPPPTFFFFFLNIPFLSSLFLLLTISGLGPALPRVLGAPFPRPHCAVPGHPALCWAPPGALPVASQVSSTQLRRQPPRKAGRALGLSPFTPGVYPRVLVSVSVFYCAHLLRLRRWAGLEQSLRGRGLVPQEPLPICTAPYTPLTSGPRGSPDTSSDIRVGV